MVQQWYWVIRFAVVLQNDLMNISSVWQQRVRVRHPRINEANVSVIGLDQTRWVVQSASFVEEQGKMGGLDSVNTTEFFSPNTPNPLQDESGHVWGNEWVGFMVTRAVVFAEILVNGQ
uniref:Uncharacterized protein n=1 Tax=Romanomermis culicivorax TaxID=13658 RepID=A0A915HMS4_ROMCU